MREIWDSISGPVKSDILLLATVATFFGAVLPRRETAMMGPAIRYKLRPNTDNIIKIWSLIFDENYIKKSKNVNYNM